MKQIVMLLRMLSEYGLVVWTKVDGTTYEARVGEAVVRINLSESITKGFFADYTTTTVHFKKISAGKSKEA